MVAHPLAAAVIAEAARHRLRRAPWGDVVQLGIGELGRAVAVHADDLRQHLYIAGQKGVGKSTMLRNITLSDAQADRPFVMGDPHGDLDAEALDGLSSLTRSTWPKSRYLPTPVALSKETAKRTQSCRLDRIFLVFHDVVTLNRKWSG